MSDRRDLEALERVTREARGEPSPELDWARIERKLMERVDAAERSSTPRASGWRIVTALAVAAVIALVAGALLKSGAPVAVIAPPAPAARVIGPEARSPQDGAALSAGDKVLAGARALLVEHAGRASWTLEPGGRASVVGVGEVITLRLESGALSARIVPSPRPESFVVEVGDARVAVHGTAFRVERRDHDFTVSVSEGVVAVGPSGARGGTPSFSLAHGDSGEFSFDGKNGAVKRAEVAVAPAPSEPVEPGKPAPAERPGKPLTPGADEIAKAMNAIYDTAAKCFVKHTPAGEVRVQVQTELSVGFGPDGRVRQIGFDPPLSPAITECVSSESAKLRVRESERGATGTRLLLLGS